MAETHHSPSRESVPNDLTQLPSMLDCLMKRVLCFHRHEFSLIGYGAVANKRHAVGLCIRNATQLQVLTVLAGFDFKSLLDLQDDGSGGGRGLGTAAQQMAGDYGKDTWRSDQPTQILSVSLDSLTHQNILVTCPCLQKESLKKSFQGAFS